MKVLMYERRSYPVVDKKGRWGSHSRLPMNFGLVESNAKHFKAVRYRRGCVSQTQEALRMVCCHA
jgi:hypothetical protein